MALNPDHVEVSLSWLTGTNFYSLQNVGIQQLGLMLLLL